MDRIVFNIRSIPALANHPRMRLVLDRLSGVVSEGAREVAPVDEGDYIRSLGHDVIVDDGTTKGIAYSTDPKALHIEYGTVDTPTFAPLRRGLDKLKGLGI